MALLKASHLPQTIGIINFQSPQTNNSMISRGKQWANKVARAAALQGPDSPHPPQGVHTLQPTFHNLQPTGSPSGLDKFCSVYTSSYILIVSVSFTVLRLTSSPLLRTCIF